ncbi:bzip transcription factor [Fusarium albosuccineum]|uniref:Bzip transcription factor n=1 Tax=Fusarium albosuccineum TaxID=1237068 RepID=A0A8H4L2Y2_9HYPO|nr:bzip transcription factor [Fusarium albosuccineum]
MTDGNSTIVVAIEARTEEITKNSPTEVVELMVEEGLDRRKVSSPATHSESSSGGRSQQMNGAATWRRYMAALFQWMADGVESYRCQLREYAQHVRANFETRYQRGVPILPDFSANPGSAAERAAVVGPTMPDPVSKRELVNASRRVANMTPSQIQSKRSIDRENQRYFRAKRKTKLEQLQSQVDALTRELENTRRELQGSQAREKNWSETFAALRLLGPGKNVDKGRIEWIEEKTDESLNEDEAFSQYGTLPSLHYDPSLSSYAESSFDMPPLDSSLSDTSWDLDIPPTPYNYSQLPLGSPSRPLPWAHYFNLDTLPSTPPPAWKSIPLLLSATTQLDVVILTTTDTFRRHGLRQTSAPFPSISSLLRPGKSPDPESCSISDAAAAQVNRSPLQEILSRVGFLYVLSHLLRWYICRTKVSYEQLPAFIKPTKLQTSVPHPAWIDVIIWYVPLLVFAPRADIHRPQIRDAIIQTMDWSRFLEYRAVVSKSLRVNWPNSDPRSILEPCENGQGCRLSAEFERHISTPENWTVDKEAADLFPFLEPVCRKTASELAVLSMVSATNATGVQRSFNKGKDKGLGAINGVYDPRAFATAGEGNDTLRKWIAMAERFE